MSSCDSDDYKSADEDINISDIGEDELDQLLADVPDNDVDTNEVESDKLKSQQINPILVAENETLEVASSSGSKHLETSGQFCDPDQSILKTTSGILSDAVQKEPAVENVLSKETSIHNVISKDQEAHDATVTNSNVVQEDHSSGWDFEDDDIVLPDSPEKKLESLSMKNVEPKVSDTKPEIDNPGWSSWGNWGVTNLISSASEGMSNLSYQMSSGFTSILENTIGAPDPEELAKELQDAQKQMNKLELTEHSGDQDIEQKSPIGSSDLFRIGDFIGGVSNLGNRVIFGGLDTLETLGKKTMEVLQEGDPGFKKKRALFQGEKVILSQVLRDAKEKAEASELEEQQDAYNRKAQYETLFDDFHGLVHLEALEMISKQCEIKLSGMTTKNTSCDDLVHYNNVLSTVKQLFLQQESCDINDQTVTGDIGLQANLNSALTVLELEVNIKNIIEVDSIISSRLDQVFSDAIEIHVKAISDLAQFTALSIELFHRIAELLILKKNNNYKDDFEALVSITAFTKCKIGNISECYSSKLMGFGDKGFSPLITNIFLEASNSGNYLENAFDLFLPILQLNALV